MSKRGQQSTAHRYDSRGCCIYCGTYRVNVEAMSLECTPKREAEEDALSESQIAEIKEDISDIRSVLEKMERQIDNHHRIEGFVIEEISMLPIAPGFSPVFTATPVPAASVPAPGQPLSWTSSDTTNFPITSSGLTATANIPATATVGATGTLSISYTNADGTVATGSLSWTIVAAPSPDITSFTIAQTT
jgi:hypothetical protein